jgi:hypothetical protein
LPVGDPAVSGVLRLNPHSTDPAYRAQTRATFYNDIPAERIPAIVNLLTPDNPLLPLTVPTRITRNRWGKIPRTFIRCALDQAIPLRAQNALIAAAYAFTPGNPTRVATLQSSHSPFLSMPEQLASVLIQIVRSLSSQYRRAASAMDRAPLTIVTPYLSRARHGSLPDRLPSISWVKAASPLVSTLNLARCKKWLMGLRWEEIDGDLILMHRLSKSVHGAQSVMDPEAGTTKAWDLKAHPMVMN